ncbi:MAG: mechanosensitive ion channel family protein [Desulfurococcaceae archaeon]
MRRYALVILLTIVAGVTVHVLRSLLPEPFRSVYNEYYTAIQAIVAVMLGIAIVETFARAAMWKVLRLGREALLVRNVVLIVGYIVLGVVVLAILGVSGESLLAGATFSGLIVGLAIQPVLANLFAGLMMLGTGFVHPGKKVRIAGGSVVVSQVAFPAYKVFSMDTFVPAIKGVVVEVGLMYTKVLLENGELAKISNSSLFSNAIILEEEEAVEGTKVQVRYEFPIDYDPEEVLRAIKEVLRDVDGNARAFLEEQSDKNYYIVLVVANTPPGRKVREFRSEILKRLVNVHRRLKAAQEAAKRP